MRTLALLAALVLAGAASAGGVQAVVSQPACVGCVQAVVAQPVLAQTVYSQAVVAAPVVAQRVVVQRQVVAQPALQVNVNNGRGLFRNRTVVRVRSR